MIVDDFRDALFVGELVSSAHVIRVPFKMGEKSEEEKRDFLRKAPLSDGGWDASFSAPPHRVTAIVSTSNEPGFLLVMAWRKGHDDESLLDEYCGAVKDLCGVREESFDEWIEKVPKVPEGGWLVIPMVCSSDGDHRYVQPLPAFSLAPGDSSVLCGGSWSDFERAQMDAVIPNTLTTFSLLNCRNVYEEKVEPSAQLQKARARRGKLPLLSYHVLKVRPVGARKPGAGNGGGAPLAEHWVRGHFADYTNGPGLFGNPNLKGRFWISPHLAGRASRTVVKDYEVVA